MRIVLAYSGSVRGSAVLQSLRSRHAAEIVTLTLDLGEGPTLEVIRDQALALGASRAHVLDTRDEFAEHYVVPALKADLLHDGHVPMALALSRPLIARKIVEIAGIEHADAVAHTAHSTDGNASSIDRLLASLAPALQVLTPSRSWTAGSAELLAFARGNGFGTAPDGSGAVETNFWGRSLRQSSADLVPASFVARAPEMCPAEPAFVDIAFVAGVPTALNGVVLPLTELVASLGMLAAAHGVGYTRNDRLLCAAPAAVLLHAAHAGLTRVATSPEVQRFSAAARQAYVDLVEGSNWFSPLREGLDAYFTAVQARVNGHVRVRLFKGEYSTIASELMPAPPDTMAALRSVPLSVQH